MLKLSLWSIKVSVLGMIALLAIFSVSIEAKAAASTTTINNVVPQSAHLVSQKNHIVSKDSVLNGKTAQVSAKQSTATALHSKFIEFSVLQPGTGPSSIAKGPDKAFWFTESSLNQIGRIAADGTLLDEYPLPASNTTYPDAGLDGIVLGPDNNLWFTEFRSHQIGRITTSGVITEFPLSSSAIPRKITLGPDGFFWFTEYNGLIGRMSTNGHLSEYGLAPHMAPQDITTGPDGALWFTEASTQYGGKDKIGRLTIYGDITEFVVQFTGPTTISPGPYAIAQGPGSALWFTEEGTNKIARLMTDGTLTEFPIPTPQSEPSSIVDAKDGTVVFTEFGGDNIGRLNPTTGQMTELPVLSSNANPDSIIAVATGKFWFVEYGADRIARLTITN